MPSKYTTPTRPAIFVIGPSIAYIVLSQGLFALIDDFNATELSRVRWSAVLSKHAGNYYAQWSLWLDKKMGKVRMHHAVGGVPPLDMTSDHKNGNPLDNREANIRFISKRGQATNRGLMKSNTSGYKGVSWHAWHQKWQARIMVNNVSVHLGYFDTAHEAHLAYVEAATELHGEFIRTGSMKKISTNLGTE